MQALTRIVYGIDFDQEVFAAEIAAAKSAAAEISGPDPLRNYDASHAKFGEVLKDRVARRLGVAVDAFQLVATFDMPHVIGHELYSAEGETSTLSEETTVSDISNVPELATTARKKWFPLEEAFRSIYEKERKAQPKPGLRLLTWHPY